MGEWIWPVVDDPESAREVTRFAAVWAAILCGLSALTAFLGGLNLVMTIIAILYGIAVWRIRNESLPWSVTAFVLCILQFILVVLTLPLLWSIAMPFAFLALLGGVRATNALQKLPASPVH